MQYVNHQNKTRDFVSLFKHCDHNKRNTIEKRETIEKLKEKVVAPCSLHKHPVNSISFY